MGNVFRYKYRSNVFNKFTVSAVQFKPDYESIHDCIEFIDPSLHLDDFEAGSDALVGKILRRKEILFKAKEDDSNTLIARFNDYIIKLNDGSYMVMNQYKFNTTFELYECNDIFHAEWINIPEMGGQLYKEFNIDNDIFIVCNDKNEKFIMYTINKEKGEYSAAMVNYPNLIAALSGFIELKLLFLYPEDYIHFSISYDEGKKEFKTNIVGTYTYKKPEGKVFVKINDMKMDNYKHRLEYEYGKIINSQNK